MRAENDAAQKKAQLRANMLAALRALAPEERARRSGHVRQQIVLSAAWNTAAGILMFTPLQTEPDIAALQMIARNAGKEVLAIPSTIRNEPDLVLPFQPDLVLVPGLAFSADGHRLGRGGGFYDRLLAGRARHATKGAVCFAFQVVASVPIEAHDVPLDVVFSG